jgi:hypothetical protein
MINRLVGNNLVDRIRGSKIYRLDRSVKASKGFYTTGYPFDQVLLSSDGMYSVLYERLGTKGIILKNGHLIREINRSFYHATAYEYPIAFLTLSNGRTCIVHCPDKYNKLEIEDVETGERYTQRNTDLHDFFHSRLSVSENNHYLLSAG